jgi:hypothetical protein
MVAMRLITTHTRDDIHYAVQKFLDIISPVKHLTKCGQELKVGHVTVCTTCSNIKHLCILSTQCFVIEERAQGGIQVTGRRVRRRKRLLDLKEKEQLLQI